MSVDSTARSDAGERPNDPATRDNYDAERAEQVATPRHGGEDSRGQQRAKTLTREEYAAVVREGGPPARDGYWPADGSDSRGQADTEAEHPADQGPAGPHDREVHDAGAREDSVEPEHTVRAVAEPLTREEYADAVRGGGHAEGADGDSLPAVSGDATGWPPVYGTDPGHPSDGSVAAPAVTHFHGEFKGRPMDLFTDGTRWAVTDAPNMGETVSEKGDIPDRLPTGEAIVDNADEGSSLLERLRREVYEESDDEIDILEKDANLVHDIFSRPPTGSYEGSSPNQSYVHATPHSGIDAGSVATAVFTLGLVIDRTARWVMQHYENQARGR
jgi:hypothetical protein